MFVACVDIGGTFTDLVLHSEDGGLEIFKSPTTPGEFERGFIDAFRLAAEAHGLSLEGFLAKTDLIVHGTTVSTTRCAMLFVANVDASACNAPFAALAANSEGMSERCFLAGGGLLMLLLGLGAAVAAAAGPAAAAPTEATSEAAPSRSMAASALWARRSSR